MKKRICFICVTVAFTSLLISCAGSVESSSSIKESTTSESRKECVVAFNTNGGTMIESQYVKVGDKVDKPAVPYKQGYNFVNWTYLGEEWSFIGFTVSENMTLVANWSPIHYSITYNLNGGVNSQDNPSTYTIEDSFVFSNATKTESSFVNWTNEKGEIISCVNAGTSGDITINANWNTNKYQVNVFTNNENLGNVSGNGFYEYGNLVTVTASPCQNCIFIGWYSDNQYTILLSNETNYTFNLSAGNKNLYAKFDVEEEYWNKTHGVIPVINDNTLTFGLYPQTHINNTNLLSKLEQKATELEIDDEEYFVYENNYYVKDTASPYFENYTFHDGTLVENGKTYYFKCEPIKWNICNINYDTYTIDSEMILNAHMFDSDSNVYSLSDLRTWLNNDFYNKAFSLKTTSSYIQQTNLTDVSTNDKVWIGSRDEYCSTWLRYSTSSNRSKIVTDFAICNHAFIHEVILNDFSGWYWTRTSCSNSETYVWWDGDFDYIRSLSSTDAGVAVGLTIKI